MKRMLLATAALARVSGVADVEILPGSDDKDGKYLYAAVRPKENYDVREEVARTVIQQTARRWWSGWQRGHRRRHCRGTLRPGLGDHQGNRVRLHLGRRRAHRNQFSRGSRSQRGPGHALGP